MHRKSTPPLRQRASEQAAQSFAYCAAVKKSWIPVRPGPRRRPATIIDIGPYLERQERERGQR